MLLNIATQLRFSRPRKGVASCRHFDQSVTTRPQPTPTALDQPRAQLAEAIAVGREGAPNPQRHARRRAKSAGILRGPQPYGPLARRGRQGAIGGRSDPSRLFAPARPTFSPSRGQRDEIHEAIALADQKAAAWKRAADQAEQAIPARQRAPAEASATSTERRAPFSPPRSISAPMLKDAELAAAWIVARRSVFLHLASVLPPGDDTAAINAFLARPWLTPE